VKQSNRGVRNPSGGFMGEKRGIVFALLAAALLLFPFTAHAEGEGVAQSFGSAVELTGGALPQTIRDITGVGSGVSSWDYLSQKIAYGYFVEVYSHFDALARAKVDMRNGVEDLVSASYRADYKSNQAIADVKFNGDYAQHVMATEFAQRSGRGTQIANTYLMNTYLPHSDGSVEYFKDGLLARIENQRSVDEFGNTSIKNLYNFVYDQDRRMMMSHEYDRFDNLGNMTRGKFSCTYTPDSVFYGTDETNVNKHYATYEVTETDHTGRVNTMTWKAGTYLGKFLRDMTQTVTDSVYGTATVHRYNMQYSTPSKMTEYEEDGVVNHLAGDAGSEVPFTYKLHRTNITYNLRNQVTGYDETRWEQPPDTTTWTDDLNTWTKITTHVEMAYLDQPHTFGPDVDPDQSRLLTSAMTTRVENRDGSYRVENSTTEYTYDKAFVLVAGAGESEFSGLSSDWYSYTDASGRALSRKAIQDADGNTLYEYSYINPETSEKVVVAETDVTSALVKGNQYQGTTESTYAILYGSPVVAESSTKTEYFGADNTTLVTVSASQTKNTYGLVNNLVKILEARESGATTQPTLDPDGIHATTRTMTTTYTYNANSTLAEVEGNGTEKGWDYSEERGFAHPYTSALTTTYEIKLDKPLEKYVDEKRSYVNAPAADDTGSDPVEPGTNPVDPGTEPVSIDLSAYITSEALLTEAWKYYGESDMANATLFLDEIVRRHAAEAAGQQAGLSDFAAKDTASEYWALNDVGTAEYLLGCIDQKAKDYLTAQQHFNTIVNTYGYAQCWNPSGTGFFWHVIDAAQKELATINQILSL
jgi:hypothetical protein